MIWPLKKCFDAIKLQSAEKPHFSALLFLCLHAFPKELDDAHFKSFKTERDPQEMQEAIEIILDCLRKAFPDPYERYMYLESILNKSLARQLTDRIVYAFVEEQDRIKSANPNMETDMQEDLKRVLGLSLLRTAER